jgi:hypothetical protein
MADCATCPHHSGLEADIKKVCALLEERKELMNVRINQVEKDVVLAKQEMDRRLEEMNQFRAQLTTQAGTFATRGELKGEAEKLDLKLVPLVKASLTREGANRWSDYLIMALISGAIVALAKLIHL